MPSLSNTPMDSCVTVLTLLASPLPLAQCRELEMVETSRGDVSILEDDSLDQLKELCLVELYLEEAHFEEFCGDIMISLGRSSSQILH